jgi:methyl-accepting chemotaxis protein
MSAPPLAVRLAAAGLPAVAITALIPALRLGMGAVSPLELAAWAALGGVAGCGIMATVLGRELAPMRKVSAEIAAVSQELARHEAFSRAQNSLDRNFGLLRETLYGYGEPRRVGDQLYFGDHLVNGDFSAVDHVRDAAGGTATVFLGDLRISTNVTKPDGSRAVGTQLAAGPVHTAVLGQCKGYRGEAEILGEAYFTVYEPILSDGAVIGVLYVGVKKAEVPTQALSSARDPLAQIGGAVGVFRNAAAAQAEAEREAIARRQASEDLRRQQDAARQVGAARQREVVEVMSDALSRLSDGDLSCEVKRELPAEYAALRANFNTALAALRETVGGVAEGCLTLRQGADEIGQAADALSRRTENQAASLEETAAALDEVTATVKATADGALKADGLVESARTQADRSRATMDEAVSAMGLIQESSRKIEAIIGVVDEIAFQTNLLALNAGVEAARAGDMGRGFAVVASEVRGLAQRSADAAKEVKALIASAAQHVDHGVAAVGRTGEALSAIASQVREIDTVVSAIASSAREQATGLAQVNTAINDMDQLTQQNAAMVEQSTAATHDLASEVARLAQLAERFRLSEAPAVVVHPSSMRRRAAA